MEVEAHPAAKAAAIRYAASCFALRSVFMATPRGKNPERENISVT
jgi:hypothetical protein